jgi:hypothetical protein
LGLSPPYLVTLVIPGDPGGLLARTAVTLAPEPQGNSMGWSESATLCCTNKA